MYLKKNSQKSPQSDIKEDIFLQLGPGESAAVDHWPGKIRS